MYYKNIFLTGPRGPAGFPNRMIGRDKPTPWRNYVKPETNPLTEETA